MEINQVIVDYVVEALQPYVDGYKIQAKILSHHGPNTRWMPVLPQHIIIYLTRENAKVGEIIEINNSEFVKIQQYTTNLQDLYILDLKSPDGPAKLKKWWKAQIPNRLENEILEKTIALRSRLPRRFRCT